LARDLKGAIHPAFIVNSTDRKMRNGVGVTSTTEVHFVITKDRVSFYDFAVFSATASAAGMPSFSTEAWRLGSMRLSSAAIRPWRLRAYHRSGGLGHDNKVDHAVESSDDQCPLSGVKRTWPIAVQMSAYDPKRTSPHKGAFIAPWSNSTRGKFQAMLTASRLHKLLTYNPRTGDRVPLICPYRQFIVEAYGPSVMQWTSPQ
jgi:hypothetical protein